VSVIVEKKNETAAAVVVVVVVEVSSLLLDYDDNSVDAVRVDAVVTSDWCYYGSLNYYGLQVLSFV
jgi:hypothetical protein